MTARNATKGLTVLIIILLVFLSVSSILGLVRPKPLPTIFVPPAKSDSAPGPIPTTIISLNTPTAIPPSLTPTGVPLVTSTRTISPLEAGELIVPILLYHHVSDILPANRYVVTIPNFRSQMERLRDLGYSTISISYLVDVFLSGKPLPSHPVVITFDDGNFDIYKNAYPIMKEMNFTGVLYIVADRLKAPGYIQTDQLKEMIADGWEVGSHSETHVDLTQNPDVVSHEELQSRLDLEEATGAPVMTFAYPFGLTNDYVTRMAQESGYVAAVGLGTSVRHTWNTLYYLSRREVQGNYILKQFVGLLTAPASLEAATPAAP